MPENRSPEAKRRRRKRYRARYRNNPRWKLRIFKAANLIGRKVQCHWCQINLTYEATTIDHKVSLYEGGENAFTNVVPACAGCNNKRSADTSRIANEEKYGRTMIKMQMINTCCFI